MEIPQIEDTPRQDAQTQWITSDKFRRIAVEGKHSTTGSRPLLSINGNQNDRLFELRADLQCASCPSYRFSPECAVWRRTFDVQSTPGRQNVFQFLTYSLLARAITTLFFREILRVLELFYHLECRKPAGVRTKLAFATEKEISTSVNIRGFLETLLN